MAIVDSGGVGMAPPIPPEGVEASPPEGGTSTPEAGRPARLSSFSTVVDAEVWYQMLRGSEALNHALRCKGIGRAVAVQTSRKAKNSIGAFLAIEDATRVRASTLRLLCDQWGLDRDVVDYLEATCPKMFAPESEE